MKYKVRYEVRYNHFPKIAKAMPQEAADIQGRVILMLVDQADPNTPVGETGNLKNNKVIDTGGIGKAGLVHWLAPYTGYVHNGTRYMAGRPFIAEAVKVVQPYFISAMEALAKSGGI